MPESGIKHLPRKALLSYEEMLRLCRIFAIEGINRIRITGGEPFLSKDLMHFLTELTRVKEVEQVLITTNGTLIGDKVEQLKKIGITSVNLSLDSLDKNRFFEITRRDELDVVLDSMHKLIDHRFNVKVNMVVMADKNKDDIIPMLELARDHQIGVRFLEEMPFNGTGLRSPKEVWNHEDILSHIKEHYNVKLKPSHPNSTSVNYSIDGFKGHFGIIASYSKTFCHSCNRIRITPQGMLKTCLYDEGIFNLRDFLRNGARDEDIKTIIHESIANRAKNGFEAEQGRLLNPFISESMATIGG